MTEEKGTTGQDYEGGSAIPLGVQVETLPSTEFVKVEKNLASLGFFTPSSKRLRNAQEKSFTVTTVVDGKRLEMKGTIIPSAKYGLPITADQDKWIALCNILTDLLRREGKVTNPISFTSADILRILHKHRHSGKNYREVEEWLDVLFSTTIFSEGVIYLANEKRRAKDRFRVLERAVTFGKELPDGKVADKNYVWFSDWQLQNINSNHLLPVDIEAYRQLKNHIAKALVLQLQVWLYATREEGIFEKRYDEICQILNIKQYQYLSLIKQTLAPSLDELEQFGYLADWKIEETSDGQNYKVTFYHGEKFHRDRRARLARRPGWEQPAHDSSRGAVEKSHRGHQRRHKDETVPAPPTLDPQLVAEFTRRGITESKTRQILANLKPGQDVMAQLEFIDQMVQKSRIPIENPPGFYIRLVESNTAIPENFETTAKRKAREERERQEREQRAAEDARQLLEWDYEDYCVKETEHHILENPAAFESVQQTKREENHKQHPSFSPEMITSIAANEAKRAIRKQLPLPTFGEFVQAKQQGTDFSLKPVAPSLAIATAPEAPPPEQAAISGEAAAVIVPPVDTPELVAHTEPAIELTPGPTDIPSEDMPTDSPMVIELVSDSPPDEPAGGAPEAQAA
jgi:hypothetical protein